MSDFPSFSILHFLSKQVFFGGKEASFNRGEKACE